MSDLKMTSRPGYTGQLNGKILERVRFLSKELNLPKLPDKFSHLGVTDGSWRAEMDEDSIKISKYIDHTLLKADAVHVDFVKLCQEARKFSFASVAVNSAQVPRCVELLKGSTVRVGSSIGFPLGQTANCVKTMEVAEACGAGAKEIDVVINIAELKNKNYQFVFEELSSVRAVCSKDVITKAILEVCLLTEEEIMDVCIIAVAAGMNFVKTSTGFNIGGATPEAVDVMLATVGNSAQVKVSGGIREEGVVVQYLKAGVRRIGTSAGVSICSLK